MSKPKIWLQEVYFWLAKFLDPTTVLKVCRAKRLVTTHPCERYAERLVAVCSTYFDPRRADVPLLALVLVLGLRLDLVVLHLRPAELEARASFLDAPSGRAPLPSAISKSFVTAYGCVSGYPLLGDPVGHVVYCGHAEFVVRIAAKAVNYSEPELRSASKLGLH